MTKIYGFVTGFNKIGSLRIMTACALSEKGKWLAGAVSQTLEGCEKYLRAMASKYDERLSTPWEFEWVTEGFNDPRVMEAARIAFERMP